MAKVKAKAKTKRKVSTKKSNTKTKSKLSTSKGRAKAKKKQVKKTSNKKTTKTPRKAKAKKKTIKNKVPAAAPGAVIKRLKQAHQDALRARLLDEKTIILYKQNKCHFQIGVAGHEAIQVAAGHVFRGGTDWSFPYYRDLAYMVALGMTDQVTMLNAMAKKDDPNCHGRQMPMHYGDADLRVVNQSSPTGTQFTQAVGVAVGVQAKGDKEVVYVSAGDGTCSQGGFHEALNWAARDKLPVIFVIQNNGFAISVPIEEQLPNEKISEMVGGIDGLESITIDGTDYEASYQALKKAHDRALKGKGPTLIEGMVPRLQSHSISDNHLKYRSPDAIEKDKKRCPLLKMEKELKKHKVYSKKELEAIHAETGKAIDEAAEWADAQPDPDPSSALRYTFSDPSPSLGVVEGTPTGDEIFMVDALNHALDEELERDDNIYLFGQDIAHGKGGVFTVTQGLTQKHGKDRVFNSQLAEASIVGVAVGMASMGLKPIAEIQFGDYVWTGMMQIRNELAMMHYRSGGEFSCPAVIRVAVGGYIHGSAYHSQNIEATFAHFPGLHVILPSNATDAKGLLKSAIRCNNPVLFLEHKGLYRQVYAKGPEGDADYLTPIGKAKVVREGTDATVITYGALVQKSILAAEELEKQGASIEVIDLRTIVPLDMETVIASVEKTSRVLIAHEDVEFMGLGAEIAAQIAEQCFHALDAPIHRLGMKYAAAVPFSPELERSVLPQNEDVLLELQHLLQY